MNVVEWTINNFSYWNGYVHEKQIECSRSGFPNCPCILLYPRGLSGCEEKIVVHVYAAPGESSKLSGHLSCIDSSGYPLLTLEIDEKVRKGDYYELLPELVFTEVTALIRINTISHPDRFTLRCELKWNEDLAYRLYTTIDVFDSSVKIDLTLLKKAKEEFILALQYPHDDCENKAMGLFVNRENTTFSIKPKPFHKNVSVSTSLSVLKLSSITRSDESEHVFQDDTSWPFFTLLTKIESTEESLTILLRVKIIPSNKYKHSHGYFTGLSKLLDIVNQHTLPTHIFYALSVTDEDTDKDTDDIKSLNAINSNKPDDSVTVLLNELMGLYQDHDFSDFQLRCGEVSFPTHKGILSARSPVFKAMLHSDMREAASDSMDIENLDVHTLGRFLVFLYTGTVDDPLEWEGALKLLYAADKYQVPTLKRECFSVFRKQVSVSNVCDILSLADKHQDEELTTEARDFILRNYNDVLRSEGWQTFIINEPLLVAKTLTYFAEKNEFKVITNS